MSKFIFAYHGGGDMPEGAADQAEMMESWGRWFGTLGDAVVDGANPTGAARTVASDRTVADGGGANTLTGYTR